MSISYAPIEPEEEIFLPSPPPQQPKPQLTVKLPKFREGTECNILIIFFIISTLYILASE
jgi:hypothetical protein